MIGPRSAWEGSTVAGLGPGPHPYERASLSAGGRIRATGVESVIARADVAKATFYRHFPSKDDVVAAWLRTPDARWLDVVVGELEGSPPIRRLVDFWGAIGRWAEEERFQGCPFLNTLGEIRDHDHPTYPLSARISARWRPICRARLSKRGSTIRRRWDGSCASWRWAWMAMVYEASTGPAVTARSMAVGLLAARLGTTPEDVERRVTAS